MGKNFVYIFCKNNQDFKWNYDKTNVEYIRLRKQLKKELKIALDKGVRKFVIEISQIFGMIACEILNELKHEYYFVKIRGIVPYKHIELRWSYNKRVFYAQTLDLCNEVSILSSSYDKIIINFNYKILLSVNPFTIFLELNKIIVND